jgi:hypothetical protein
MWISRLCNNQTKHKANKGTCVVNSTDIASSVAGPLLNFESSVRLSFTISANPVGAQYNGPAFSYLFFREKP